MLTCFITIANQIAKELTVIGCRIETATKPQAQDLVKPTVRLSFSGTAFRLRDLARRGTTVAPTVRTEMAPATGTRSRTGKVAARRRTASI